MKWSEEKTARLGPWWGYTQALVYRSDTKLQWGLTGSPVQRLCRLPVFLLLFSFLPHIFTLTAFYFCSVVLCKSTHSQSCRNHLHVSERIAVNASLYGLLHDYMHWKHRPLIIHGGRTPYTQASDVKAISFSHHVGHLDCSKANDLMWYSCWQPNKSFVFSTQSLNKRFHAVV